MPTPCGAFINTTHHIPFMSMKGGSLVYAKLPVRLEQEFIEASRTEGTHVQCNLDKIWWDWTEYHKNASDDDRQYVVIKLAAGIERFLDALFSLKVFSEGATGRWVAALQGAMELASCILCPLPAW